MREALCAALVILGFVAFGLAVYACETFQIPGAVYERFYEAGGVAGGF